MRAATAFQELQALRAPLTTHPHETHVKSTRMHTHTGKKQHSTGMGDIGSTTDTFLHEQRQHRTTPHLPKNTLTCSRAADRAPQPHESTNQTAGWHRYTLPRPTVRRKSTIVRSPPRCQPLGVRSLKSLPRQPSTLQGAVNTRCSPSLPRHVSGFIYNQGWARTQQRPYPVFRVSARRKSRCCSTT